MNLPEINLPRLPQGLRSDFAGVADPLFDVRAEATGGTIRIFDVVGADVTASRVSDALRQIGNRPATVQFNSPGGDYFEGVAIYNVLRNHTAPVTGQVLGIAASAAAVALMGCTRIEMARGTEIMIHNSSVIAIGGADTMSAAASILSQIDQGAAEVFSARTALPVDRVKAMMAAETFMNASQAVALGFADAAMNRDGEPQRKAVGPGVPQNKREMEAQLRAAGFSRTAATKVAAVGWSALAGQDPETEQLENLAAVLARLSTSKG